MKRLLLLITLLCTLSAQAQTYWDGTADKNFPGEGTQADPYLISTPEQLAGLAERTNVEKEDFAGKYIKLTADIYLNNFNDPNQENWKEWHPIAHEWWKNESEGGGIDYGYFRGHFDGNGHTIYNLYYNGGEGWGDDWDPEDPDFDVEGYIGNIDLTAFNRGLFCNVDGGSVENLNLSDARMNGMSNTALLVVKATNNSVIRNCHVQGSFRGFANAIGGIVSQNDGLIENCSANINITTAGGGVIVHTNKESGVVRNCTATGEIYATAMSTGAFADTNDGLIEKSSSSVNVTCLRGKQENGRTWGHNGVGFIHSNNGTARECFATGNVTINSGVVDYGSAGFCQTNMGLIESCFCTGTITDTGGNLDGDAVAQFVANNGLSGMVSEGYPVIRNCFSTSKIVYTDPDNVRNCTGGFVYSFNGKDEHDFASFPFCWFNAAGLPSPKEDAQFVNGFACWGKTEAELKSQAFVDTLNLCASFLGTSQWELRDGIPQPTGVYVKNTAAFFDGGEGTKDSPYLISNKNQLENFRWMVQHGYGFMNEYVLQTADIELNEPEEQWEYKEPEEWTPIGSAHSFPGFQSPAYECFLGNYDGGFHEVRNMYIENNKGNQGFFGSVGSWQFDGQLPVIIQNLGVTDAFMVVKGVSGILASEVNKRVVLKQCWTSGTLETLDNWGSLGALYGGGCDEGFILNCSSSARIKGISNSYYGDKGFVSGNMYYGWMVADTLVNYIFTGNINNGESGNFINNGYYSENVYEDGSVANITYDGRNPDGVRTTEWLQSKECVNLLNSTVKRWNAENDETKQLNYWQWNEGAYPTVCPSAEFDAGCAVNFNSNGGTEVVGMIVVSGSTIQPPVRPTKENYLFGGWYKDEALTQLFKFGSEPVETDLTLYARWLEDKRFEYDITPFSNKRAKTYHIQTAAQLRGFAYLQNDVYQDASATEEPRDFTDKTIVLDNDIFLNDTTGWHEWGKGAYASPWRSIGSASNPYQVPTVIKFKGTFDGQGHVIYGLYAERGGLPSMEFGGLFYRVGEGASICNLGIEASVINLKMQYPKGQTNDARWYYYGDGTYTMGYTAMLANWIDGGVTVSQCYASGVVYGPENDDRIGGLTGQWPSTITNCYSRVNGYFDDKPAGYFIGDYAGYPNIANCYNASIARDGIRGYGLGGDISSFYFDDELVAGDDYRYDIVKNQARTTTEMKQKSTYEGWDFDTVWGISSTINDGYPFLRQFHPDAPAITINARSYTREYGEENPTFEFTTEGEDLQGTPEIVCEATAASPVGEYPIVIRKGSVTNENDTYVNGILTITKAPLCITAKSYSVRQSDMLPQYELEYSGFRNGETEAVLTRQPVVTCEASSASLPGTYDIVASDAEAANYEISYENGTLTITPFKCGDVNNDGHVDVADLTGVVHFILNESTAGLNFESADMDESGTVEINDYAALVKLILNRPKAEAPTARRSPAILRNLISLSSDGKGEILVSLLEESRFTGLQFDLILPDGVTLAENGARSESSRHGCWYARHEDGSYAILCSSMSNAELHEGPVLRLRTDAKADGTASVCNVVLSDIYSTRHEAAPAETFMEDATAIAGVTGDGLTVRTGHGTLSLLSGQDRTVTVYGVGGMVITETDLVAGKANTIKLPAGVYIVNNRKVTVR